MSSTPRHRSVSTRACDRCRRRKAKVRLTISTLAGTCSHTNADASRQCNAATVESNVCTNCENVGAFCTFDLPTGKRGPKFKHSRASAAVDELRPSAAPQSSLAFHDSNARGAEASAAPGSRGGGAISAPETTTIPTWSAALSPHEGATPGSVVSISERHASTQLVSSLHRWVDLSAAIRRLPSSLTLEAIAEKCFNLFFQYLFPLIPLVHETGIREALHFFVTHSTGTSVVSAASPATVSQLWISSSLMQGTSIGGANSGSAGDAAVDSASSLLHPELWPDSAFTLITALCAEAAFMLPKEIFPEGYLVADIFLQASRNCLHSYLEADLEHPNANSVAIRYFHSNCLHAAGKPKYSWHIFGEAVRLAQVMQLQEESSHEGAYFPVEAELRRRAFWIVYLGDKSAAILNNRPITIHKFSFESGITTAYPSGAGDEVTFSSPGQPDASTDVGSFITGFNANIRLWQSASDLLLELRLIQDRRAGTGQTQQPPSFTRDERVRLDALYVRFATSLDDLPPYLQPIVLMTWHEGMGQQQRQFVTQVVNLQVTYHCLRMVIVQKLEEVEYPAPGVEQDDLTILRKTEIARDMLRIIREAPFWALQVNGESCVEKIRLIGASLLAIIHRNETSPLSARARADFSVLLDILTRLDSKASDTLRSGSL
ncbi:uncharacterized protein E0L32_005259 [Thyridium curvatum]|uniref:Xylanolytic transcriptional activator regulatory domain-containing protein n=1 Tax=Thyridium curvatum TaxID=1093900 RepID=A0A507B494_9PEZI|nr:uncharacterized protein E0L32_005259 [Thyridium curvatum]TPX14567.1 hypothetical protein E0L32_005259 [Thyridium curvatum]